MFSSHYSLIFKESPKKSILRITQKITWKLKYTFISACIIFSHKIVLVFQENITAKNLVCMSKYRNTK